MEASEEKRKATIAVRQQKDKAKILEYLKEIPNISYCIKKIGTSRATFYRWRKEDHDFKAAVEEAINEGEESIGDMAEYQLVAKIKEGNLPAIKYYLSHRNNKYRTQKPIDPPKKEEVRILIDV